MKNNKLMKRITLVPLLACSLISCDDSEQLNHVVKSQLAENAVTSAPNAPYLPNWDSLDSRPNPAWFENAKFGIFIHWGPYSVPAYTPKGMYSEWYQYWLNEKELYGNYDKAFSQSFVYDYHNETYGEDFTYEQFADDFKADLFKPDDWASLFEKAGAKYVVLTSKHHDGFALWPSKEANDRGFPWNSMETGAKRDLVGELTTEIKKTNIKMGLYYSLYEWYHPQWKDESKRAEFVDKHFHPQFKDLIESYQPDLVWGDGEWDMPSADWKTPELISWLYNESSVKDTIVINDRWGTETRKKHGGYLTTEYEAGGLDRVWEESRGMGFSFGYNQNEDIEDYNSPQSLILTLVDIVSNGGNLLLDIGPDSRGRIPVIMQERLLQIGKWLDINGEAIYGTRASSHPMQWSAGKQDYKPKEDKYVSGDTILKFTVDPDPGFATKDVFFTEKLTDEGKNLYAITPRWHGQKLILNNIQANSASVVTLLATGEKLLWENEGNNLVITLPVFDPSIIFAEKTYAYTFKITNIGEKSDSNH